MFAVFNFLKISIFCFEEKNFFTLCAVIGPIPSIARISSSVAALSASMLLNVFANRLAVYFPT